MATASTAAPAAGAAALAAAPAAAAVHAQWQEQGQHDQPQYEYEDVFERQHAAEEARLYLHHAAEYRQDADPIYAYAAYRALRT